jgi:hypothetical protein
MTLSFEFVNNCKPGDLLRVKIEDTAEFAILGANEGHGLRALAVLKDNDPPFAINLLESGRIDGDFETYAALVCGKCDMRFCPTTLTVARLALVRSSRRSGVSSLRTAQNPWWSRRRPARAFDTSI